MQGETSRGSERLHKILAQAGVASLRACEQLIQAGRVAVNGQVVNRLGSKIDPNRDHVTVDGREVILRPRTSFVYIMLHKPRGVISTVHDPHGRPTVLDLVDVAERIFPVGRLDKESEGLLLLTNDGTLAYRLTHPRYQVEKEYHVLLDRAPDRKHLGEWRRGIMLEGERTAPAKVEIMAREPEGVWLRVVLREGRKRQIREVARLLGYHPRRLVRVREGNLKLGNLPYGKWRMLHPQEVALIKAHALSTS